MRILGVEIDGSLVISRTRMTNEYKTKPAGAKPRNARLPTGLPMGLRPEGFHRGIPLRNTKDDFSRFLRPKLQRVSAIFSFAFLVTRACLRQSTGYDESFPISFHHAFRLRRELKEEIFEFMRSGHIDCDREDAGLNLLD